MVQKIVNAEVKASLRFKIMVRDLDIYYFKGYCSSNITIAKMQTQGIAVKDSCSKKFKAKNSKSALSRTNVAKPLKQDKKNKKNQRNKKKKFWEKKEWNNILATGNNTINT